MAYKRNAALDYAEKYWKTNCHDGVISTTMGQTIGVEQRFRELRLKGKRSDWDVKWIASDPNDNEVFPESAAFVNRLDGSTAYIQKWDGLGDCAHFMCRTLSAGGIEGLNTDYVPYLNSFLRNLSFTKVLADEGSGERVGRIIKKRLMKRGDIILYIAPPSKDAIEGYAHSAMFVSNSTITCHTVSRWDEDWKAPHYQDYTFTLIHFSHDDPPTQKIDEFLGGWWQVTWRSETYYYFFGGGKVFYTQRKPSGKGLGGMPANKGYYFSEPGNPITICWPQTASVEEFTPANGGRNMNGRWNDSEPMTAVKLNS